MSGFLIKGAKGEDTDSPNSSLEDMYMKMFPKIARDFVHRDDLALIIQELIEQIDPTIDVNAKQESSARARAQEYKSLLAQGKLGSTFYPDLINLDED